MQLDFYCSHLLPRGSVGNSKSSQKTVDKARRGDAELRTRVDFDEDLGGDLLDLDDARDTGDRVGDVVLSLL